jgi:NADH:ubiquinone oxidoreductase subunit H
MSDPLAIIISFLLYPGIIFGLVAAVLFGWLRGMARSLAQGWRIVTPAISVREITRRLRQTSTLPEGTHPIVIQALPILAVLCPLLALVFLPFPGNCGLGASSSSCARQMSSVYSGDVVVVASLLLVAPLVHIALGWSIQSPYTRLAATRSARRLMGYLVPLTLSIATLVGLSGAISLPDLAQHGFTDQVKTEWIARVALAIAGATYAMCIPGLARLTPVREGYGSLELVSGELTELSGRELLLMRLAESLQFAAVIAFGVAIFILPYFHANAVLARILIGLASAIVVAAGVGAWEGISPRFRSIEDPSEPLSVIFGVPTFVGIFALLGLVAAVRFGS